MDVEFRPPAVGTTQVPIKITGPGTIELRDDGLFVVGAEVATRGRSLAFLLGLVAVVAAMYALREGLGLGSVVSNGVGIGIGGALVAAMLRRPATAGDRVEQRFAWPNVNKVFYDASSECLVVVIKKMKPKGGLFIVQPPNSELQRQLEARIR